jgi:hypothetical protein
VAVARNTLAAAARKTWGYFLGGAGGELEVLWELEVLFELPGALELPGVLEVGEPGVVGDLLDCEFGVVGDVWVALDGYELDWPG